MSGELSELPHQVRFLTERLDEIEAAATPEVEAELGRMGNRYMRRYWGMDP